MTDPSKPIDVEALRAEFLNVVFDEYVTELEAENLVDYAKSCGETASKFTDPNDPDFQAPPTIGSSLHSRTRSPKGFPQFQGLGMDAGKAVSPIKPMRAGVPITVKTHMHDIYTKSGRSGRMVFFVHRMEFSDQEGELLGTADTSVVIREKPQE